MYYDTVHGMKGYIQQTSCDALGDQVFHELNFHAKKKATAGRMANYIRENVKAVHKSVECLLGSTAEATIAFEWPISDSLMRLDGLLVGQDDLNQDWIFQMEVKSHRDLSRFRNPFRQIIRQANRMKFDSQLMNGNHLESVLLIPRMTKQQAEALVSVYQNKDPQYQMVHVFYQDTMHEFTQLIESRIKKAASHQTLDKLTDRTRSFQGLYGSTPPPLTKEQAEAFDYVTNHSEQHRNSIIHVNGAAGTGKSFLIQSMMHHFVTEKGKRVLSVSGSSEYKKMLNEQFPEYYAFNKSEVTPEKLSHYEVVIVDEVGRFFEIHNAKMQTLIDWASQSGKTLVLAGDINQRARRLVRKEKVDSYWNQLNQLGLQSFVLTENHRHLYQSDLEHFKREQTPHNPNQSKHMVIHDSMKSLVDAMNQYRSSGEESVLSATYSWEFDSNKLSAFHVDNETMVYNQTQHEQPWLLRELENVEVNEVGSLYTLQGLEVDHVGIVIGPSLVIRGGQFDVNNEYVQEKTLKSTSVSKSSIIDALKSEWYVLFTRHRKTCHVYIADAETRNFFLS